MATFEISWRATGSNRSPSGNQYPAAGPTAPRHCGSSQVAVWRLVTTRNSAQSLHRRTIQVDNEYDYEFVEGGRFRLPGPRWQPRFRDGSLGVYHEEPHMSRSRRTIRSRKRVSTLFQLKRDPRDVPLYGVTEAALYVGVP